MEKESSHPLQGIKATFEFSKPKGFSLRALCDPEKGGLFSLPSKDDPAARKQIAGGIEIAVRGKPQDEVVVVEVTGSLDDWGSARFIVDNLYSDLAAAGMIAPLPGQE